MARAKSRPKRWEEAVEKAKAARDEFLDSIAEAHEEMEALIEEWTEWRDNVPENLQETATYEKLDALAEFDLSMMDDVDTDLADLESLLYDAENAELPLGYGKD